MADVERKVKQMACGLRPLEPQDAAQATQVERDAFPTQGPSTSFRRESHSRIARYLVAWEHPHEGDPAPTTPPPYRSNPRRPLQRLLDQARARWFSGGPQAQGPAQPLVGLVGVWFMVDEAHITTIGVLGSHRGRGIGEILLIGAIELAYQRGSRVVTLETRVSNHIAQSLYRKYGFLDAGLRHSYYTDNHEDALIMTTPDINTPEYQQRFQRLVQAHQERWGQATRILSSESAGPPAPDLTQA